MATLQILTFITYSKYGESDGREGLLKQFLEYYANSIFVVRGEPIKNEFVKKK